MARWSPIEPSPGVTGLEARATARLLSGVLLVVVGFGTVTTALQLALVPGFFPGTFLRVAGALVLLGLAWGLARTRHFRISAWAAVVVPLVATAAQGVWNPADVTWWAFMMLSPLLATMFLTTRAAAAVAATTALTATAILLGQRAELPPQRWVGPIAFHCVYAPLLLTAAWHRTRLERRRHEELAKRDAELAEARRMEAIGRLAGGIAHDFNNLLTVVIANAELLALGAKGDPHTLTSTREIVDASNRAAALTHQLLAFAKRQPHHPRPVSLARVVDELEPMIRRLLGEAVALEVSRPVQPATVVADSTLLERVVMNLVANAREAMPEGGTLRISTAVEAGQAVLSVRDTGVGMDAATRARIFEPFFSARPAGGGTGLGLATTRSIVEQCGGTISVSSAPGEGAEFRIALPLSADSVSPAPAPPKAPPVEALELRVLLVEDDEGIRKALQRAIAARGVSVVAARSGEEALALAATTAFDVLVTDVVMPGMHGPALVEQLRQRRPSLPVIFISGHHEVPGLAATPGAVVLDKPLRLETLLEKLSELGAPRP